MGSGGSVPGQKEVKQKTFDAVRPAEQEVAEQEVAKLRHELEQQHKAEVDRAQKSLVALRVAQVEAKKLQAENEHLKQAVGDGKKEIESAHTEVAKLKHELEQQQKATVDADAKGEAAFVVAQAETNLWRAKVEELQQERADARQQIESAHTEVAKLKHELQQQEKAAEDAAQKGEAAVIMVQAEADKLKAEVDQLKTAVVDGRHEVKSAHAKVAELKSELEQQQKATVDAAQKGEAATSAAQAQANKLKAEVEQLQKTLTDGRQDLESAYAEVAELKSELEQQKEATIDAAREGEAATGVVQSEANKLKTRVEELEEALTDAMQQTKGVARAAQEEIRKHQDEIKALHQCVADATQQGGEARGEAAKFKAEIKQLLERVDHRRHTQPESIWEALKTEHVCLVRMSWLMKQSKAHRTLPRRQDLPPEAFIGVRELQQLYRRGSRDSVLPIIAISLCWLTPEHPDPEGKQLAKVTAAFERDVEKYQRIFGELGVFWDWLSLYQKDGQGHRTEAEERSFRYALKETMDLWYAHQGTTVYKLISPKDVDYISQGHGYGESGCTYELCSASRQTSTFS